MLLDELIKMIEQGYDVLFHYGKDNDEIEVFAVKDEATAYNLVSMKHYLSEDTDTKLVEALHRIKSKINFILEQEVKKNGSSEEM